jgi:hypothetical protein
VEDVVEEFIKRLRREAIDFGPAFNHNVVVSALVYFDVWTGRVFRAAIRRQDGCRDVEGGASP